MDTTQQNERITTASRSLQNCASRVAHFTTRWFTAALLGTSYLALALATEFVRHAVDYAAGLTRKF